MGQYHIIVNLDKKQYIQPWDFDNGAKLMEFGASGWGSAANALCVLLAEQSAQGGRGGGDMRYDNGLVGSWAGDRITIAGDYATEQDTHGFINGETLYVYAQQNYENVGMKVRELLEQDGAPYRKLEV